jgi:dehydrogenase/reductase SDR family protein 7B
MNWTKKNVWIIGASSGIGQALALELNSLGACVIMSARNSTKLQQAQTQLQHPKSSQIIALDLNNSDSLQSGIAQFKNLSISLDVLIHCGGISQRSTAMETDLDVCRQIFESNFFGQIPITQFAVETMRNQGFGKIVVISSFAGKWGFYLRSSYAASKHALHGYYESLRMEEEKYGITVQLVTPGFIATDISKHAIDGVGKATGEMDENQAQGIDPKTCAIQIRKGMESERYEFGVGGKETMGLWIHRHFPNWFQRILRKQNAR